MRFVRIDKQTGSGAPTQNRYAYLLPLSTVEYFPEVAPDGVRLLGDIVTSVGSWAIPVYLTSSSQEFSYETLGNADEESYLVKFTGTHPGTELEALSFAQNMVGEHFLILIPNCDKNQPWKVLGEYTNPLIFTSSHRAGRNGSVFTFNFEQAIPSEYIYFSYDGVVVLPEGDPTPDPDDPGHGFDPTKWARRNAENIDGDNVLPWRIALDIYSKKQVDDRIAALLPDRVLTIGAVTATANKAYLALPVEGKNEVTIDGTSYARNVAQTFPFTPVATHLKVVIIEAKPDAQVFHLVEGEEGPQAKEPTYTGLFVARLIISPEGVIVEQGESGVKNISEDGWRVVPFVDTETFIEIGENPASKFEFTSDSTSDVSFCGIIVTEGKNNWQGKTYWLKNSGTASIDLGNYDVPVPANKKLFTFEYVTSTVSLKPKGWAIAVVKGNMLTVVAMGSGDIDLTPYATNARVDAVQAEIDAEEVNRAAADVALQNSITAEETARRNADLLKMDKPAAPNNTADRVMLADNTTKPLSEIGIDKTGLVDKMLSYWDETAGKLISSGLKFVAGVIPQLEFTGRIKAKSIILPNNTDAGVPNELGYDGQNVVYGDTKKKLAFKQVNVFNYTPTGNFSFSALKTVAENAGFIFNDLMINVSVGTNNYTCSLDIGAANIGKDFYMERLGTGSISFTSTRTLNSGTDGITIMNGGEGSMTRIRFGTVDDIINVRNLT